MNFETNLKCENCIAIVTPILDQLVGAGNWKVELNGTAPILRVAQVDVHPKAIERGLASIGYKAKEV
jgi:copper chaperone